MNEAEHSPAAENRRKSDADGYKAIAELVGVMAQLRDPENGCAWDLAQDFASIAPYTIEEAYEVADAIEREDFDGLRDELGDLQLQVVFHSRMAEERGLFSLTDVISRITEKMVRRHPHIFGGGSAPGWEKIKAEERAADGQAGALDGVAKALPALLRAQKLQKRAARTGFDWPDSAGPRAKVSEEIAEVEDAGDIEQLSEEIGDLLFAVVNWARHLGVDAEEALRKANAKFENRFAAMEAAVGPDFPDLAIEKKEALWEAVKR